MKIEELIEELQKIKDDYGNFEVIIYHRSDERESQFNDKDLELMVDDDRKIIYL